MRFSAFEARVMLSSRSWERSQRLLCFRHRDGHELALLRLGNRLWRVSYDPLAGGGCGELLNRAFHTITLFIAIGRVHLVVIGRLRLQTGHAHAENRLRMAPVDPYGRFRRLAQLLGISTIMHDSVMNVRPSRVFRGPPDNGEVIESYFKRRLFGDLEPRRFLLGRR